MTSVRQNIFSTTISISALFLTACSGIHSPLIKSQLEQNQAAYDGTVAAYRQTVLGSFQEVQDVPVAEAPGTLSLEFTPRGEAVWLSARDDNRVVIYVGQSLIHEGSDHAD